MQRSSSPYLRVPGLNPPDACPSFPAKQLSEFLPADHCRGVKQRAEVSDIAAQTAPYATDSQREANRLALSSLLFEGERGLLDIN